MNSDEEILGCLAFGFALTYLILVIGVLLSFIILMILPSLKGL